MREAHRRWHNVTLPLSDPWWNTYRPPNGWRCRCRIVGVTQAEYDAGQVLSRPGAETDVNAPIVREPMQKVPPQDATMAWRNPATGAVQHIPVGIDPGFDYNAGASGRSKAFDDLVRAKLAALGPAVRAAALADGVALREAIPLAADSAAWQQRQQALGFATGKGWELQPHEVEFYERFAAAGERAELIQRSGDFLPTNDFLWTDKGLEIEVKKPKKAHYASASNLIRSAVAKAKLHDFVKDCFIIDLGDKPLTDKLRGQLAQYNIRHPENRIRSMWVMSKGALVEITLLDRK